MKILISAKASVLSFIFMFLMGLVLLMIPVSVLCQPDGDAAVFDSPSTDNTKEDKTKDIPLHVVSDKMIALRESAMVEFIGNVKATRLDSVMYADSVKVYFQDGNKEKQTNQSDVKQIIATGNVRYTAGERKAFADRAVYTTRDEVLILTGQSAKVMTGSSFVTGRKITLYRLEDKVMVESEGNHRVEALFNPEDNKSKDNKTEKQQ